MAAFGLALLAFVGVALIVTGLPAFLVLIFAAVLGAGAAVVSGTAPPALLGTLSSRLVHLFESDLLQALPLYVLMGALLNRLTGAPAASTKQARTAQRRAPASEPSAAAGTARPLRGARRVADLAPDRLTPRPTRPR